MYSYPLDDEISDTAISADQEEEIPGEEPNEFLTFLNEEIEACFALFDKKKIGEFDVVFLKRALNCLGIYLTKTEMEEFQELVEFSGVVYFNKFQAACLAKLKEIDPYEFLKIAFRAFDPDQENFIPTDRLKKWMMTLGDPLTEKEAKDLVKLGDPGGKGIVVYDDLAAILCRK